MRKEDIRSRRSIAYSRPHSATAAGSGGCSAALLARAAATTSPSAATASGPIGSAPRTRIGSPDGSSTGRQESPGSGIVHLAVDLLHRQPVDLRAVVQQALAQPVLDDRPQDALSRRLVDAERVGAGEELLALHDGFERVRI